MKINGLQNMSEYMRFRHTKAPYSNESDIRHQTSDINKSAIPKSAIF